VEVTHGLCESVVSPRWYPWAAPETLVQSTIAAESPMAGAAPEGGDQAAPDQKTPPASWNFSAFQSSGRADYQVMYMKQTLAGISMMENTRGKLMSLELESTATLNNGKRDFLDFALQFPYYTQMEGVDGRGKPMHFFNAYAILKLGLGKPNIRFGQFVMPFGNLPYYETHTRPIQSMFPQSLGVRVQRGVSVEGIAGPYDYWAAVMGDDDARAGMARIARKFDLAKGTLAAGLSGLYGVNMPRFSALLDPIMDEAMATMPLSHSVDFTDKKRFALDAEYSLGRNLWRGELVVGRDLEGGADGQLAQWNLALSDKDELMAQFVRWNQPAGTRSRVGAWYGRKLGKYLIARLWAEFSYGRVSEADGDGNATAAGLQFLLEIPKLFRR
jgi:hypothetical protein